MHARKIIKWVALSIAWTTGALIVLIGAGLLFLHSDPGRAWLRDKVVAALDSVLAGQIFIGRLEGNVFDRFSLLDVEVRDDLGEVAIRVDEMILDTDLWELAQQRVAVDEVILERLQIMARVRADGSLNLTHVIEPQPESEEVSPWIVSLDRLAVHDGAFSWTKGDEAVTHVDDIDIETRVITGGGDTSVELEHLRAYWREGQRPVFVHAGVAIHDTALTARDVELRLGDGWLKTPLAYFDWERGSLLSMAVLNLPEALTTRIAPELGLASDIGLSVAVARVHQTWPMWLGLWLATDGGKVGVYGSAIPEQPAVSLRVTGDSVDLASIMPGLPPTMLDLQARIVSQGSALETLRAGATLALRGRVAGQPIDSLRVRAGMRDGRAEVHTDLRIPAGTLAVDGAVDLASGRGAKVPVLDDVRVRAALTSLGEVTAAIPEFPGELGVTGEAEVDVRVNGPIDALAIKGQVSGRGLRWQDIQVATLGVEMDLRGLPGRIQGSAKLAATQVTQVEERYGDIEARLSTPSPRDPHLLAVELRVSGRDAFIPLFVAGTVRQTEQTTTIALGRYELATAQLQWRGSGGAVRIDAGGGVQASDIALRSRAGQVTLASALVDGPRTSGALSLDQIDLAEISRVLQRMTGASPLPVTGHVSLRAQVDLRGRHAAGTLALQAEDLAPTQRVVAEAGTTRGSAPPSVDVTAEVTLARDALDVTVQATSAEIGQAGLVASVKPPRDVTSAPAWQALDERALTSLKLDLARLDLARLRDWAPDALGPVFSGKVAGAVTVAAGADSADVRITMDELRVHAVGEPISVRLDASLAGRQLSVDTRVAVQRRGRAELQAAAELPARLTSGAAWQALDQRALRGVNLAVTGVDLDYWLGLAGITSELGARGTLTVTANETGRSADIDARVTVPANLAVGLPPSTIDLAAELTRGAIDADVAVSIGKRRYLHGDARWQLGLDALVGGRAERFASAPARVDLELDDLPLAQVGQLLAVPARLQGKVRGTARLTGSLSRPDLAVDIRSDDAVVAGTEFRTMAFHGSYHADRARLVVDSIQAQGGLLDLDAVVRLTGNGGRPTGELELYAEGFDLGFVGDMLDEMDVDGFLDANLTVQGTADAPVARGSLRLREGLLHMGAPLRRLHDAEVRIDLEKDRVWLREVSARAGNGRVALSGSAELDGLVPRSFQLRVNSNELPLELGAMIVKVDTDLRIINGKHTAEGWTAEAIVKRALIRLPDESGRELHDVEAPDDVVFVDGQCVGRPRCAETLEIKSEAEAEALAAAEALRAPVPVRIEIRARDTIEVRSKEARAIVGANLVVDTRAGELDVSGSIASSTGYLELFGRRYQVRRAVASFGGTTPEGVPDPGLDVLLAHEFPTLTLFLQVQGTASEPELELSSEPGVYDEATLLSFVLGADPESPAGGEDEPGVRDRAVGVASGLVMGQVQGLIQEVLPVDIDVFRVELGEASARAERLVVGKWLTDELLLSYSHNFIAQSSDDENTSEASLEYRFRKRWLVDAYIGDRGSAGLDLLWSKRF
ncbi:MAG TPA: translocation/assembly module TamB domain-containing protein [Haliangium sp.]|nr:translocation/assembly module TamB domain-containing protein [Haliangium sp.]